MPETASNDGSFGEESAHLERCVRTQEEGLARFSDGGGGVTGGREKQWRRFESYAQPSQLPDQVQAQKIYVDLKRASVILPINGFAVPFHINTLKSLTRRPNIADSIKELLFEHSLRPVDGLREHEKLERENEIVGYLKKLSPHLRNLEVFIWGGVQMPEDVSVWEDFRIRYILFPIPDYLGSKLSFIVVHG